MEPISPLILNVRIASTDRPIVERILSYLPAGSSLKITRITGKADLYEATGEVSLSNPNSLTTLLELTLWLRTMQSLRQGGSADAEPILDNYSYIAPKSESTSLGGISSPPVDSPSRPLASVTELPARTVWFHDLSRPEFARHVFQPVTLPVTAGKTYPQLLSCSICKKSFSEGNHYSRSLTAET